MCNVKMALILLFFLQELVENPTREYLLDRSKRVLQFVIK